MPWISVNNYSGRILGCIWKKIFSLICVAFFMIGAFATFSFALATSEEKPSHPSLIIASTRIPLFHAVLVLRVVEAECSSRRYWCVEGRPLGTQRGQQKRVQEQILQHWFCGKQKSSRKHADTGRYRAMACLRLHNALQTCKILSAYFSSSFALTISLGANRKGTLDTPWKVTLYLVALSPPYKFSQYLCERHTWDYCSRSSFCWDFHIVPALSYILLFQFIYSLGITFCT